MIPNAFTHPDRFWNRVDKSGECWLWRGKKREQHRYGLVETRNRAMAAHRYAYELTHGPIPAGLLVCHHCDTKLCVRPDHLFLGTHLDNNRDAVAKGRMRYVSGEAHGRAKLSWKRVEHIRAVAGRVKTVELATRYGVTRGQIYRVLHYQAWIAEKATA